MGREDLHKNMEDTFSDKEIFQAGDLSAYDCTFLLIKYTSCWCWSRWKISISLFFFFFATREDL
jgi:hypothetical protein